MSNTQKTMTGSSTPTWFKVMNSTILVVLLSVVSYIVINNVENHHETSSGAGDIWWHDAPEMNESYHSYVKRVENQKQTVD